MDRGSSRCGGARFAGSGEIADENRQIALGVRGIHSLGAKSAVRGGELTRGIRGVDELLCAPAITAAGPAGVADVAHAEIVSTGHRSAGGVPDNQNPRSASSGASRRYRHPRQTSVTRISSDPVQSSAYAADS